MFCADFPQVPPAFVCIDKVAEVEEDIPRDESRMVNTGDAVHHPRVKEGEGDLKSSTDSAIWIPVSRDGEREELGQSTRTVPA